MRNTLPPAFSPSGREFLSVDDFPGAVRRFGFPSAAELGVCKSAFGEEDPFEASLCYLDETRALAHSSQHRIALLHTSPLRFVKEVVIEGHEPKPVEEHFPLLRRERQLYADISYFHRIGTDVVFVCPGPRGSCLLLFSVGCVLEREGRV